MSFGPEPTSVSSARAWAATVLRGWADEALVGAEVLDPVRLVVSELVGNAVRHARTPIRATLLLDGQRELRLEVEDASIFPLQQARADVRSLNGRGLALVDRLSDRWGVDHGDHGKTVWAAWDAGPASTVDGV